MILSQQSLPKVKHLQLQKQTHEQLNLLTICFMSTIHILYLSNKSSTKEIPLWPKSTKYMKQNSFM